MSVPALRTGLGFDVHRLVEGRRLVLGGVDLDHERGLLGHSDADALAHAVADALLGAAGLGDLGQHFPDDDPAWEGADSIDLLGRVAASVRAEGWDIANADATVVLEAPRLAPHRQAMEGRLSEAVGAPVSVKATRAEGMGAIGRAEGILCLASALLVGAS